MKRSLLVWSGLVFAIVMAGTACGQEITEKEPGLYVTREIRANVTMGPHKRLVIRSAIRLSGSLNITTEKSNSVTLAYTKRARADSKAKGIDYIDLIAVSLDQMADHTRLEMRAPNPAPWDKEDEAGIVVADLVVPTDAVVGIDASGFDVSAVGPLHSLVVQPSLGKVEAHKVTAKLDVTTANQRILLEEIAGDISAATTNASIVATNIACPGNAARFRNEGGDIKITGLTGAVNAKNSYGRIDLNDFRPQGEPSFVRGNSAPVIVEIRSMRDGRLVITNQFEDIEVTVPDSISANFSLAVDEDGAIETTNLRFKTDLVEKDRLNLRTGNGDAEISGSIRGKGRIYVRGVKAD
ncbi:MAG: hypothetical protein AB1644_09555 [Candidatus Zixiibacteriota bacterium]